LLPRLYKETKVSHAHLWIVSPSSIHDDDRKQDGPSVVSSPQAYMSLDTLLDFVLVNWKNFAYKSIPTVDLRICLRDAWWFVDHRRDNMCMLLCVFFSEREHVTQADRE
jgi:hypothetical protein